MLVTWRVRPPLWNQRIHRVVSLHRQKKVPIINNNKKTFKKNGKRKRDWLNVGQEKNFYLSLKPWMLSLFLRNTAIRAKPNNYLFYLFSNLGFFFLFLFLFFLIIVRVCTVHISTCLILFFISFHNGITNSLMSVLRCNSVQICMKFIKFTTKNFLILVWFSYLTFRIIN